MKKNIFAVFAAVIMLAACKSNDNAPIKSEVTLDQVKNVSENEMVVATIETNMGTMEFELYARQVPKTVENFAGLAMKNYYNGIIFHRIIKGFVIQGGDPTGTGMGGESLWGGKFADEFAPGCVHDAEGVLSMANAGPNTNGSQFFITLAPQPHLNGKHTVFGKIISGLDVMREIGNVPTSKPYDKPYNDVVMESVSISIRPKN